MLNKDQVKKDVLELAEIMEYNNYLFKITCDAAMGAYVGTTNIRIENLVEKVALCVSLAEPVIMCRNHKFDDCVAEEFFTAIDDIAKNNLFGLLSDLKKCISLCVNAGESFEEFEDRLSYETKVRLCSKYEDFDPDDVLNTLRLQKACLSIARFVMQIISMCEYD